jgi:sec-independent protein translocase protein TatB
MFDIGWSEFLVIGVVALIVIGPKELPGVLRMVGQWTTKVRRMASEFQGQFQEAMREAEMADLKKEVDTLSDTAKDFTSGMASHFDMSDTKDATKWEPKAESNPEPKPEDKPELMTGPNPEMAAPASEAAPAEAAAAPPLETASAPAAPAQPVAPVPGGSGPA